MAKATKKDETKKVESKVIQDKENKIEETKKDLEEKVESTSKKIVDKPRKIEKPANDEQILCRSCVIGNLFYKSVKTGLVAIWNDIGTEEYLEFGELITMKSSQSRFLNEPWIIVEDERAIKCLGLEPLYNKLNDIEHIEDLFSMELGEIKNRVRSMPSGLRKMVGDKAMEMIQNESLYDMRVIKLLEDELNIELIKVDDEE